MPDLNESKPVIDILQTGDESKVLGLMGLCKDDRGLSQWSEPTIHRALLVKDGAWGLFSPSRDDLWAFLLAEQRADQWDLQLLATHPERRRQGLMRQLLTFFLSKVVAKTLHEGVWLEVHIANLAAQKLYEGLGFRHVGDRPHYYQDGATARLYLYS